MATVLIIEDEENIQRLTKLILQKNGHEGIVASTGEQGLTWLAENDAPNLILLDIMMPGIDGLDVLEKIKKNNKLKEVPVIMLTALAQENVVLKGVKLGAKDYIRKPFHPKEILERIDKYL